MNTHDAPTPQATLDAEDWRALVRLAGQGTVAVTDIVEGVHHAIWPGLGFGPVVPGRTRGIPGAVYRSIRGVTRQLTQGIDRALHATQRRAVDAALRDAHPTRNRVLAIVNGVMGDSLAADGSPFALTMSLRLHGQRLDEASLAAIAPRQGRLLLLIHGLCMSDLHWSGELHGERFGHGEALAEAGGYLPLALRYNSGLHISDNGRALSAQLEWLARHWPVKLESLSVVAHSMGGLVMRAAVHAAREAGHRWPRRLRDIVFLGTPHHGAPLERAGNGLERALGWTPYSAPIATLGRLRSAGITDLRHGNVIESHWHGQDRFAPGPDRRTPLPLPNGVRCYAIAATRASSRSSLHDRLVGDGLVPLPSALGEHPDPAHRLRFDDGDSWIAYRTDHLALLTSADVRHQLCAWLAR